MRRLGKAIVSHSKLFLFGFVGLIALSSIWGFQAFGNLKGGGYDNPNSDSSKVAQILKDEFDQDPAEVIVLVDLETRADSMKSDGSFENFALVDELSQKFADVEGVAEVFNYYSLGMPPTLVSTDGKLVYILVDLDNSVEHAPIVAELIDTYSGDYQGAQVHFAGFEAVTKEINHTIEADLIRAEIIAVPIVLLLLILVFGSVTAASLPLIVGGLAIVGSFFVIYVASQYTDVSIFALNLITGLGLGLGIDYSLLVVNRFREERAGGNHKEARGQA
jgi:RND superfamily putative drug exporter